MSDEDETVRNLGEENSKTDNIDKNISLPSIKKKADSIKGLGEKEIKLKTLKIRSGLNKR